MRLPWRKKVSKQAKKDGPVAETVEKQVEAGDPVSQTVEKQTENDTAPSKTTEEKASPTFRRPTSVHWLEEAIKEHESKGGFADLPGKGKPISRDYLQGDAFYGVLKHNNALPPWLELQHDIRDTIEHLLSRIKNEDTVDIEQEIAQLNKKIARYNNQVPTPALQKSTLRIDNIAEQYKQWV